MTLKDLIKQINDLESEIKNIKLELDECRNKKIHLSGIEQIKYLIGTINGIERFVYLFYENHMNTGECNHGLMVSDWLNKLFNKTDRKFIDFYLEITYFAEEVLETFPKEFRALIGGSSNQLYAIQDMTYNCIEINKSKCPYKNLRVHYTDFRKYTKFLNLFIGSQYEVNDNEKIKIFLELMCPYEECNNVDELIFNFTLDKIKDTKIEKQWITSSLTNYKKCIEKIIKINIQSWKNEKFTKLDNNKYLSSYDIFTTILNMIYGNYKLQLMSNKDELYSTNSENKIFYLNRNVFDVIIIHLSSVFMDLYLMGRLFKKFNGIPEYAKYSIVYAGFHHCKVYDEYLKSIGFKEMYNKSGISKEEYQCIDISDMPNIFIEKK